MAQKIEKERETGLAPVNLRAAGAFGTLLAVLHFFPRWEMPGRGFVQEHFEKQTRTPSNRGQAGGFPGEDKSKQVGECVRLARRRRSTPYFQINNSRQFAPAPWLRPSAVLGRFAEGRGGQAVCGGQGGRDRDAVSHLGRVAEEAKSESAALEFHLQG